jgi:hypothetical protein
MDNSPRKSQDPKKVSQIYFKTYFDDNALTKFFQGRLPL